MRFAITPLPVLLLLLSGCVRDLHGRAGRQATEELRCAAPGLRVRAVGVLESRPPHVQEVSVFDAEGCDAERRYYCVRDAGSGPRCAVELAGVVSADAHAGLARALWLLRTQTRGRCPGETQRVVQESQSLFVLEACDGRWQYHCRATACERLR